MRYMTYAEEMRQKYPDRPWISRPTWELRNMVKALKMAPWLNTEEDTNRLMEAERELKIRRRNHENREL